MIDDILYTSSEIILELDNSSAGDVLDLTYDKDVYLQLPSSEISTIF